MKQGSAALLGVAVLCRFTAAGAAEPTDLSEFLNGLRFRGIGPAVMGGRITQIAVNPRDKRVFYVATASSGIFKTVDNGTTFEPIFDRTGVAAVGALALAPSDPNQIWVGTGEANLRGSNIRGKGVYKSPDAGRTWEFAGLGDSYHIGRITIDPIDPRVVYVAAIGHVWGPSRERGLFKTSDGGATWNRILYGDDDTGVFDVVLDPEHNRTLYATASSVTGFRRHRDAGEEEAPQSLSESSSGGRILVKEGGIYRSSDAGATWIRLANGLPKGSAGRISLDVACKEPRVLVALLSGVEGGVYRSDDRGDTWRKTASSPTGSVYISEIRIDPANAQRIWASGADPLFYSENGGKTFCSSEDGSGPSYCAQWLERIHFDDHAIWIDSDNSDHMMTGTDGGLYVSYNRGRTWEYNNTLPMGQFYQIGFDMQDPYWVYGGKQDTGTWGGPSRTLHTAGIANGDWIGLLVGDGYYTAVDPTDPNTVYAEYQGGRLFRLDKRTGERRDIRPVPPPGQPDYRVAGENHPFLMSFHNPTTIYFGGDHFFTSRDRGETWSVSPELTKGVITSIAESPLNPQVLWAVASDASVQLSRDGGKTWANAGANLPGAPKGKVTGRVIASRLGEGSAYISWDAYQENDPAPYLYATVDFGHTWRSVRHNLPEAEPIQVVREHPGNTSLLFVGTLFGLYVSIDAGETWYPLNRDLPPSPVYDLAIHPRENDLIVGTHGRGIFILDDLGPLEQLSAHVLQSPLHLFRPRTATTYRMFNDQTNMGAGNRYFLAPNPVYGASISFYAASPGAREIARITILDQASKLVREFDVPVHPSLNRVRWDLHSGTPFKAPEGLREDPPGQPGGPRMRALLLAQGPLVLPGRYTVRVDLGGHRQESVFTVKEDPRIQVSREELAAHREAWQRLARMWAQGNAILDATRKMKSQLDQLLSRPSGSEASQDLRAQAKVVQQQLDRLDRTLASAYHYSLIYKGFIDPGTGLGGALVNRIGQMLLSISMYTAPPTPQQQLLIDQWDDILAQLSSTVSLLEAGTVPVILRQLREAAAAQVR
jgi:photosystem II stability/assembly factor-like uncharacterized protein